ncbi:MAG: Mlc titration factor MtfA (ptsG expression regulator) [Paraglaciecola sp.]|jgi:Mlc titration factor MtfA (ptsG expression regulator)
MSPANRLSMPFIVIAMSLFGVSHFLEDDGFYAQLAIPFVLLGALCYVFAPQINWRYHLKKPPVMDFGLRHLLETKVEFYKEMHPYVRKQFRERVTLFIESVDFKVQVSDEFPSDMRLCIAGSAVRLLMGRGDYHFPKFENVILYPHPFPSPKFPEHWHTAEFFEEDGVVMFAAQPLLMGFINPKQYYNVALHEYTNVFQLSYPELDYPTLDESAWGRFQQISGFSKAHIVKALGLPDVSLLAVATVHFFVYPRKLAAAWPELSQQLEVIYQTEAKS